LRQFTKKEVIKNQNKAHTALLKGKTIRHINIETLDPFGYSIADTIASITKFLSKSWRISWHIKISKDITIREPVTYSAKPTIHFVACKESERLVRSRDMYAMFHFLLWLLQKNSDSVDIFIRELDNWSIGGQASVL